MKDETSRQCEMVWHRGFQLGVFTGFCVGCIGGMLVVIVVLIIN